MKLFAIGDLHLGYEANREALKKISPHPDDWLIIAGDVGESAEHLHFALSVLSKSFKQLIWVPGNHDLWSQSSDRDGLRGEAKYRHLVSICHTYDVLTPEDPYTMWTGAGPECILAPLFLLYDYSFRPADVPLHQAVNWAMEANVLCTDEGLLHPDPYPTREAWCGVRCQYTERRLKEAATKAPLILINHFPLHQALVTLHPRLKRFSIWCGTRVTESWHIQFPVIAAVFGHLHIPATHIHDGVRFEEVSFGYPKNRDSRQTIDSCLREILPGPTRLPEL